MKRLTVLITTVIFAWGSNILAQPIPDFSPAGNDPEITVSEPQEPEPTSAPESKIAEEITVSVIESEPVPEDKPVKKNEGETPVIGKCQASKISYIESAARKLHRAMKSKGYRFKKVELESPVAVESSQNRFVVYAPDSETSVVGLVSENEKHNRAYIVANTTRGRIVATITWGGCRPAKSKISYPKVDTPNVELEPFKYWGFRVLWNLPKRLGKKSASDALTRVIKNGR